METERFDVIMGSFSGKQVLVVGVAASGAEGIVGSFRALGAEVFWVGGEAEGKAVEAALIEGIRERAGDVDAIVVVGCEAGMVSQRVLLAVTDCAMEHGVLTVADVGVRVDMIRDFDVVVSSAADLGAGLRVDVESDEDLSRAAGIMTGNCRVLFVVQGADGISVFAEGTIAHSSAGNSGVATSAMSEGAADKAGAATAAVVLSLLSGASLAEAADIANAAACVARQRGGVQVTREEIEDCMFNEDESGAIVALEQLSEIVKSCQADGKKVVWTNGCFDILHVGHVKYLIDAAKEGDVLVVGLNSDASVQAIKGAGRPVVPEHERVFIVAALGCVDYVTIFSDQDTVKLLDALRPNVYAKGGDYTIDTINQDERKFVEGYGGRIALIPGVEGLSTTSIIEKLEKGGE